MFCWGTTDGDRDGDMPQSARLVGVTEQAAVTSSMMETELGEIDPGSQGQEQAVAMVWTPTEATPRAESCVSATSLTLVAVVSGMPEVSTGNHEAENAGHS